MQSFHHTTKLIKAFICVFLVTHLFTGCRTIQQQDFRQTSDDYQFELILSAEDYVTHDTIKQYVNNFILEHMASESFNTYTLENLTISERSKNTFGPPVYYQWIEADYRLEHHEAPVKTLPPHPTNK